MSRVRLVPIIFIAVITLAILFGGWQAYLHFNMIGPLENHLSRISGVRSAVVESGQPTTVRIQLGDVDDLETTYQKIYDQVSQSLGSSVSISIEDTRDTRLVKEYQKLTPALLEGVAKGNYTEMIAAVEKQAAEDGIQAAITMDKTYVYVQMNDGKHHLYDVFKYTSRQGGAVS
ncbi:hypothetical protein [Alicyclobacillus shizuokensis]|uniref:hypothetical protein n=1 Tax=Alicyclobacillus shizuokensis TaxID=392014 RepID=UPI000835B060|nr:hypothetical protein [Alicyclobacillus shizuokensis]MCL6625418.1 hypothetical protein [Alicyclobacillus shizuokensis]